MTTKCRSGRNACSALITASLPTPLGPLTTRTRGCKAGTCGPADAAEQDRLRLGNWD